MPVELAVVPERIATDASTPFPRRLFAAAILLMSYATLRFGDVQGMGAMEANNSVLRGTMWKVKAKKAAAAVWATPRAGATGAADWHVPLLVWNCGYAAERGSPPTFALPQIHTQWAVVEPAPMSYTSARRYLVAILCHPEPVLALRLRDQHLPAR